MANGSEELRLHDLRLGFSTAGCKSRYSSNTTSEQAPPLPFRRHRFTLSPARPGGGIAKTDFHARPLVNGLTLGQPPVGD